MPLIFHQNMLDFGGRSPLRNGAFNAALTNVNTATGAYYWVAGFTELLNAGAGLRATLLGLARTLDAGLTGMVVVEVGTTAVGVRREFVGITWDPNYVTVQHVGQVLRNALNRTWRPNVTAIGNVANQLVPLPAGTLLTADSRGLAFIGALINGNPFLIGFMHNMYNTGDKSSAYTNLSSMAELARGAMGGAYAGAEVIIGGDFNLKPRQPKRPRGAQLDLVARAAVGPGGAWLNTTNTHPYDFWLASRTALTNANAAVYAQTRVAHVSDHAAITLMR